MEIIDKHDGLLAVFVRGDLNASSKNKTRADLLSAVITRLKLSKVKILFPTYHHFTGHGLHDSDLDVLLYGGGGDVSEVLLDTVCKVWYPLILSHHDILISQCSLPPYQSPVYDKSKNITAPRIQNTRFSTKWIDKGVAEYVDVLTPLLPQIRETWGMLKKRFKPKVKKISTPSAGLSLQLLHELRILESSPSSCNAQLEDMRRRLATTRNQFKKEVRDILSQSRDESDIHLHDMLSNPQAVFRSFRAAKKDNAPPVKRMKVGDKVYEGHHVADGMFDSLHSLKAPDMEQYSNLPPYSEAVETYKHIIQLASKGKRMPLLSLSKGEDLLKKLKPSVTDFYSITSLHFLHLGKEGIFHFVFLVNSIIDHVNASSIEELNTIWANILHKGHDKDPELDRSWRTISCCPLLAKAIDTYMVELYDGGWSACQAPTQFQGSNSSHELAALSISEAVVQGLHIKKEHAV
jgi:hypothetical protein